MLKPETIPYLKPVSKQWEHKNKSNIIKYMQLRNALSCADIAKEIGTTASYINNKLNRNSFSLDDMILIAELCGYSVCFISKNDTDAFKPMPSEKVLQKIDEIEDRKKQRTIKEYERLRNRVMELEKELCEKGELND